MRSFFSHVTGPHTPNALHSWALKYTLGYSNSAYCLYWWRDGSVWKFGNFARVWKEVAIKLPPKIHFWKQLLMWNALNLKFRQLWICCLVRPTTQGIRAVLYTPWQAMFIVSMWHWTWDSTWWTFPSDEGSAPSLLAAAQDMLAIIGASWCLYL